MPFGVLFLKMCNVVNVLQNCQQVQVNSFLTQTSCTQRQGHPLLNAAGPEASGLSLCFQPPSQEAQKPVFKNRKRNKGRKPQRALFWEMQWETSQLHSCLLRDTKGHTCLLHLRCSCGKACAEGQQSINQSVHHKHP